MISFPNKLHFEIIFFSITSCKYLKSIVFKRVFFPLRRKNSAFKASENLKITNN